MRLSDSAIRHRLRLDALVISPKPEDDAVQPTSVDLHLGATVREYAGDPDTVLDAREGSSDMTAVMVVDDYILPPGGFVLGSTREWIEIPQDLVGVVEGKSSLGRLGLAVHITAGFIDPGFHGNITLELKNMNNLPIRLYKEMPICQICFETVKGEVFRPYGSEGLGSKYQDSYGTVEARGTKGF